MTQFKKQISIQSGFTDTLNTSLCFYTKSVQINIVQDIFLLAANYFYVRICMREHLYQICV